MKPRRCGSRATAVDATKAPRKQRAEAATATAVVSARARTVGYRSAVAWRCAPLATADASAAPVRIFVSRAHTSHHSRGGDGDLSSALTAQFSAVNVHAGLADLAMDALSEGISIADFTQRDAPLIYVNSGFCRMTGFTKAETVGHNCRRAAAWRRERQRLLTQVLRIAGSCKDLGRTQTWWRTCAPLSLQASPSLWSC